MNFDDVYAANKSLLQDAEAHVKACQNKLCRYMANQDAQVLAAEKHAARKIILNEKPSLSVAAKGMDFNWRFWTGVGHFNDPDRAEIKLVAKFSWSPSDPENIQASGTDIVEGYVGLDDFIGIDLVQHMSALMNELLLARAKMKFPHLD